MTFWTTETWKAEVEPGRCRGAMVVDLFDPRRLTQGSYELSLGDAYCISAIGTTRKILKECEQVSIPPGQFALLTTKEHVTIPADAVGWISIKSTFKLRGLVNISGFHVDPGFSHRLKFSVYNAGGTHVTLSLGTPVFLLWLASLDRATDDLYANERLDPKWPITDADVMTLNVDLASPALLRKDLNTLEQRVTQMAGIFGAVLFAVALPMLKSCLGVIEGARQSSAPSAVSSVTPLPDTTRRPLGGLGRETGVEPTAAPTPASTTSPVPEPR